MSGTLYIVATPIGNLEDITLRALRILREADLVAAEDTRHTLKLLSHYEISTSLVACHQHSGPGRIADLVRQMADDGRSIALVTDAGTPGVSDPGVELVSAALAAGVPVVPIPGASAALCALIGSGLPPAHFCFEGFLPRAKSAMRERLTALARSETRTMLFYEAANRLEATLGEMAGAFGVERAAAVGRELTKKHEEFVRGTLADIRAHFAATAPRGEITIVVAGREQGDAAPVATEGADEPEDISAALASAIASGMSERDAVRTLSQSRRLSKRDVYAEMLKLKGDSPD